ncbi:hypothetical protein VSR01_22495 [Actinacidiphila sp. DG2A-62]|uniref:hypothetical protein n=1 Tax=Actinacidiphila sp. DG2A-62 TaxID=3108821 RepID=UPI002DBF3D68|nr:hypothetical protein [Actinacidiphila sp. DG2A-62]MEC3996132.1 hypothetical protein [Actinacidiphila sp. DG2A-62]
MAVKTTFQITHPCGHIAEHDLGTRRADERAGLARWLSERPRTECWKQTHQADATSTREWLQAKRAEEQAESEAWSAQYRMPPLDGAERAVVWAIRCRHQLLTTAYTTLVIEGGTTDTEWEAIEDKARTVTRAGWWIDQRDSYRRSTRHQIGLDAARFCVLGHRESAFESASGDPAAGFGMIREDFSSRPTSTPHSTSW